MIPERKDIARRMREVLRGARDHRRELTLEAKFQGDQSCLDASGAIRLTIRDFLPTLEGDFTLRVTNNFDFCNICILAFW